jgi:hypothetical protein
VLVLLGGKRRFAMSACGPKGFLPNGIGDAPLNTAFRAIGWDVMRFAIEAERADY